jgi:hypothetical protein
MVKIRTTANVPIIDAGLFGEKGRVVRMEISRK